MERRRLTDDQRELAGLRAAPFFAKLGVGMSHELSTAVQPGLPIELPAAMEAQVRRCTGERTDPVKLKFIALLDGLGLPVRQICEQAECGADLVIAARRAHPSTVETGKEIAKARWMVIRDLALDEVQKRFQADGAKGASLGEIGLLACQSETKIGELDGAPGLVVHHRHELVAGPQDWRERWADLASDFASDGRGPQVLDIEAIVTSSLPHQPPHNMIHSGPVAGGDHQVAAAMRSGLQEEGGGVPSAGTSENVDGITPESFPPQKDSPR